jgi:hypothetical protein
MIKRIASILLTFPAILIILAHSIIPHHHHHDRVCFNQHSFEVNHGSSNEHKLHTMAGGITNHECHFQTVDCNACTYSTKATKQFNNCNYQRPIPCYHCHHDGYPDESESSECCMLAETIIFHPGPQRQELTCPNFEIKDHSGPYFIITGLLMPAGHIFTPGNLPFRRKPCNTPPFLAIAVQTPGLRAPPSC